VHIQFLLGPAGSGKTFHCLAQIRQALIESPDGPPLLLLAPKQTTYQLERQLLADPALAGYTRLHILSFDRLAHFAFERLRVPSPPLLDEEGRLMVLRGLLARKRKDLQLFRASARLTGFARQLSILLRDIQHHRLTPQSLRALAEQSKASAPALALKLADLALLLEEYLRWLDEHGLQDAERLLSAATNALAANHAAGWRVEQLWVDGFADFSPQELELLVSLLPYCGAATVTFCLDEIPAAKRSWLSTWAVTQKTFEDCRRRIGELPEAVVQTKLLHRAPDAGRFAANSVLRHLENHWADSEPPPAEITVPSNSLRLLSCADPETEAIAAAREIVAHVRAGGRYREVTVLARSLADYHQPLQQVFTRYEIPFFLDQRHAVSHHPLAELTRSAVRTVAFQWKHEDWFAALKTGLVCAPSRDRDIDQLENEALARGWKGAVWQQPLRITEKPPTPAEAKRLETLQRHLEELRKEIIPPFEAFSFGVAPRGGRPKGPELAGAIRELWDALKVKDRLEQLAARSDRNAALTSAINATVLAQMEVWLQNLELAFPGEELPLRDWLPILEAGLSNLTVGVIPPALDQVLIGAVDRSRNPEVRLAVVVGLNESVFPATPQPPALLTPADHEELERRGVDLAGGTKFQLSRERFYGYLAFTRASRRLVLTSAIQSGDAAGSHLNPSPFITHLQQLFPALEVEKAAPPGDWRQAEHASELVVPMLQSLADGGASRAAEHFSAVPALGKLAGELRHLARLRGEDALHPELAARLYGPILRSSVSRLEQFAACPFRFFVHSGLRAEERKLFELDIREQGTFQHDALAEFHEELKRKSKRWRDITPAEARLRMKRITDALSASYRDGLLQASEQSRFMARVLAASLQDFIETLVGWMHRQYLPDPAAVELPFGFPNSAPAWEIDLGEGRRLALRGRIDRVDVYPRAEGDAAYCVVLDYKSSQKRLDSLMVAHGLQLQLLAYLNVICQWPSPKEQFGASRLIPAGVFYINLRGGQQTARNRIEARENDAELKTNAYRHAGRFDVAALRVLDARSDSLSGDQFSYRLTGAGELYKNSREALSTKSFDELLQSVPAVLRAMGREIFAGTARRDPYRYKSQLACDTCDYRSICRIDPWLHKYRTLRGPEPEGNEAE
jgi:ATP-dependent helicase/nuclease subunit B